MTLVIYFVLVGEGPTERDLVPILERLCLHHGVSEVIGQFPEVGKVPQLTKKQGGASTPLGEKVRRALKLAPRTNLLFVHRDADAPDATPRYQEIQRAVQDLTLPHVAVVPVQETETWLLLDEAEIRRVAENPKGRVPLGLPPVHQIESIGDPKKRLQEVLGVASGLKGRVLADFQRGFGTRRSLLLQSLSEQLDGPIQHLPAWQRLNADLQAAIDALKGAEEQAP